MFADLYNKFLFQSIIYNQFLSDINRKKIGDSTTMKLRATIITWNLANIPLQNMLLFFTNAELENVDLFAIGVQECSYMAKSDWIKHIKTMMNYYGFTEIKSEAMCEMFLMVFIRNNLYKFVDCVFSDQKAMGFCGLVGNKGGLLISFRLMNYQFVFVYCKTFHKTSFCLAIKKLINFLINICDCPTFDCFHIKFSGLDFWVLLLFYLFQNFVNVS